MTDSTKTLELLFVLGAIAALFVTSAEAAKAPRTGAAGVENLGDGLLDGLLDRLPEAAEEPAGDWLVDPDAIRQRGREARGEDLGDERESPLRRVVDGMREAQRRIADERIDEEATPVQREVVAELDRLIAEMEKQCQNGQCDKPSEQDQRQASKRSQPKPSSASAPAGQAAQAAQSPARDSTTRMGSAPVSKEPLTPPDELMKAAWGHLPERLRERMLQSSSEEFLPEYREELEAYYRRLAEREAEEGR